MTKNQLEMSPVEAAYLFVEDSESSIKPLPAQSEISTGDQVAVSIDGHLAVGKVLWQGQNMLSWVTEATMDGHSWQLRVLRSAEMLPISALEFSTAIGMSKLTSRVNDPEIGKRLQKMTADVCILNEIGSEKNWCRRCHVPLTVVVHREVTTTMVLIDRTNKARIRCDEPTDISDTVESVHLFCAGCDKKKKIDWSSVHIEN